MKKYLANIVGYLLYASLVMLEFLRGVYVRHVESILSSPRRRVPATVLSLSCLAPAPKVKASSETLLTRDTARGAKQTSKLS